MSIPDDHGGRVQAVRRELYELRAEVETLRRHDMLGSLVRTGYPIDEQLRRGERALWLSAKRGILRRLAKLEREVDALVHRDDSNAPLN